MYHINKEITGNGENLTLKNTAKHYYKKFDILGNSKQETREGYNLLNYTNTEFTPSSTGWCFLDGKAGAYGSNIGEKTTIKAKIEEGKTYRVAVGSIQNANIQIVSDTEAVLLGNTASLEGKTFTATASGWAVPRLMVAEAGVLTFVKNVMIYEGTESKPYEQYGASPSMEYEAPIESVGDDTNLFDISTVTIDRYLDAPTGNLATSSVTNVSDYITVKAKKTYTISFDYETLLNTTGRAVCLFDLSKKYISSGQYRLNNKFITITPEQDGYLRFAYDKNCFNIKVVQNSKATAYSPFGQGSIDITHTNKNLLFIDKGITSQGIISTLDTDGALSVNGTATSSYANLTDFIQCKLPINKYTFSIDKVLGFNIILRFYDKTKATLNSYYIGSNTKSVSLELFGNEAYYRILMLTTANNSYDFTIYPQLELGNDVTVFTLPIVNNKALYTQQPFRAIGDVTDRFVKQNGVWYEEHSIERLILNGTENWGKSSNTNNNIFYIQAIFNTLINKGMSNYFTYRIIWDIDLVGVEIYNNRNIRFGLGLNSDITTLEQWKAKLSELYNAGTPLYVDYVLREPTLIPCTSEQAEVLEYFEKEAYSYDEVTHIYSTDEVSPYFEVTSYQRISEEFKTRLKEGKITRGYLKVLATDTLPEIIINENNYLKDLKIEELRYVPEEGIIGGTVAKRVSGNFNNVDSSFDIQDREIEVYLGVELEDETTEYIKYGTYIVQRPEDDQVNDNTSFEALDYMIKFNQEYKDRITYPCTLKQLLDDIIDQAGVNSKVATFANSDFIVENNQFEQGSTLRDVLKAITQVAFNWSRIDADDNLVMDFEIREETDEELGTDDYFSFKKSDDYGPVNVVILRNSQVEGENVTVKDEKSINGPSNYNKLNLKDYGTTSSTINSSTATEINITAAIGVASESVLHFKNVLLETGKTYIIQRKITTTAGTKDYRAGRIEIYKGNGATWLKVILSGDAEKSTFTVDETGIYSMRLYIAPVSNTAEYSFTVSEFMVYEGTEEKPYQPYIPIGEIEYVISDNPFAYTELKRKQLIEAGRRLFGFKYTPMTVDMLGLMYLNSKDRISVENLNGQKYSTYLFDHTIDYTGIVLDSMESKSKSKTETKYQYVSSLAQGLSHVEIKVDKANKRIESIIESQEDVSEKVAKTVARIEVVYALSDSPTTAPTDGWSTTAPEWTAGKYMWQKTITTYANGTTAETAATNISGAKGEAGKNGIGITQTNITYQKSTSGTTVPTGTWQTTIPEVDEDGYLWTRTEFIYSDGSKKYAYNVGKKGATGIGVKSIIDQYYSSTSNTEVTGGEWKETQDTLQTDRFIWTRSKITWTNGSVTYTDPILANTLNDINSNIIVFKDFKATQESTNKRISSKVEETTKKLNDEYLTADKVNEKIDKIDDDYTILESRVAQTELDSKRFKVSIETIQNTGVDKIKTSMGYTFNDNGLNIDRTGSDTSTVIDEAKIKVTDKTGGQPKSLLYAGYVKEGDTEFSDYEGQTIVATSNLIVQNFLIIGSNSRFQDYYNETLDGNGTGAFDI